MHYFSTNCTQVFLCIVIHFTQKQESLASPHGPAQLSHHLQCGKAGKGLVFFYQNSREGLIMCRFRTTRVAIHIQLVGDYYYHSSLVPRPRPAFCCLQYARFPVLQVMESWAGPGKEATIKQCTYQVLSVQSVNPREKYGKSLGTRQGPGMR